MVAASSINVTLTPELEKFVRDRFSSGKYQSEGEVLLEGLILLEQQERESEQDLLELKAKLERASAQADRGEFITPEQSMERIEELKRQRASDADWLALKAKLEQAVEELDRGDVFTPEQVRAELAEMKRSFVPGKS